MQPTSATHSRVSYDADQAVEAANRVIEHVCDLRKALHDLEDEHERCINRGLAARRSRDATSCIMAFVEHVRPMERCESVTFSLSLIDDSLDGLFDLSMEHFDIAVLSGMYALKQATEDLDAALAFGSSQR